MLWPQFYVEALVDAFHALKVASAPGSGPWADIRSLLPRGLQDIITFLVNLFQITPTICSTQYNLHFGEEPDVHRISSALCSSCSAAAAASPPRGGSLIRAGALLSSVAFGNAGAALPRHADREPGRAGRAAAGHLEAAADQGEN